MPKLSFTRTTLIALCGLMLVAPPLMADPPAGKGNPGKEKQKDRQDLENAVDLVGLVAVGISATDARNIAVKYSYTSYKPLPPGIRKNLARGKPLPPGIAKTRMPSGLIAQLPVHVGYEWQIAGIDLILVSIAGHIIADVLHDVFL
jgi:hypothetical protein